MEDAQYFPAIKQLAGVRLLLSLPEKSGAPKPDSSVLYFKVADIQSAYTQLQSKGVVFQDKPHRIARMPDHDLWMVFFQDSENKTPRSDGGTAQECGITCRWNGPVWRNGPLNS